MADTATTTTTPAAEVAPAKSPLIFSGTSKNLVPGAAFLFAGLMAFSMGMTDVFFAEAIAWTFAIWGALFIFSDLRDINETYEVTDDALIIRNVLRIWAPRKTWDWGHITRLDVVVKRPDAREQDVIMQIYYTPEGEIAMEREDRAYNPVLAAIVTERAGLKPADKNTPKDVTRIPRNNKTTFTWK